MLLLPDKMPPQSDDVLNRITNQLSKISETLNATISIESHAKFRYDQEIYQNRSSLSESPSELSKSEIANMAKNLSVQRKNRRKYCNDVDLFGEPAWDILLDLYYAAFMGYNISVKSACIASEVPATTAIRYLDKLEMQGLIARSRCFDDRRMVFVKLTKCAVEQMEKYLLNVYRNWIV